MSVRFVLDSWAVLHLLEGGKNAAKVDAAIETGDAVMSWMNLGEVDYIVRRRHGAAAADGVVADLRAKVDVKLPDMTTFRDAARIKALVSMAYADAFAAATGARYDAPILTGDPELLVTPDPSQGLPKWTCTDLRK